MKKILSIIIIIAYTNISVYNIRHFNSNLSLIVTQIVILNHDLFGTGIDNTFVFLSQDNGYELYNSNDTNRHTKEVVYKFASRMRVKLLHSKKPEVINRFCFEEMIREFSKTNNIPFYMIHRIEIETKKHDKYAICFNTDSTYSLYMINNGFELIREMPMLGKE